MKVKVEFIVLDTDGNRMKGRQSWIVKNHDDAIFFGNIYKEYKDACDLTDEEFEFLKNCARNNFEIVEVIE